MACGIGASIRIRISMGIGMGASMCRWSSAVVVVSSIVAVNVVPSVKPVIEAASMSMSVVVVVPVPPAASVIALIPVSVPVPPPISEVVPVTPVASVPVSVIVLVVPDLVPPSVSPDPSVGPYSLVGVVGSASVDSSGGPPVVDGLSDCGCGSGGCGGDTSSLSIVGERVRGRNAELICEFVVAVLLELLVVGLLVLIELIFSVLLGLDKGSLGLGHTFVVWALVDCASHLEVLKFNFNFFLEGLKFCHDCGSVGGKFLLAGLGGSCDMLLHEYLELPIPLGVLVLEGFDLRILSFLGIGGGGGDIVAPRGSKLVIERIDCLLISLSKLLDVFCP